MVVNTNWYVITGGPSSGKTRIIEYLAFLGYRIIPEAARILIDVEKSKGKTIEEIRADEAEFQRKVLQMKIDIENRLPLEEITFFDRGIPDSIAYYKICKLNPKPVITVAKKRKYKKVFLLEQLLFEEDYARAEDEKLAYGLSRLIYTSYLRLGYDIVHVPVKPIDERVKFILSKIQK